MSCEACDRMHCDDATVPHDGLHALHKPGKLRPLGRKPVLIQRYQCGLCGTNWLCEYDPQSPEHSEWVCLHHAASILDPLAACEPEESSPPMGQHNASPAAREPIVPNDTSLHPFRPAPAT